MLKNKFLLCGLMGWCLEIFWTGLASLRQRQRTLTGRTSFWMFPIYGMAAFLEPLSRLLSRTHLIVRGIVYALGFFLVEYASGSLLKRWDACPWDYSQARLNYKGLIRLDYLPVWFLAGLLFEQVLKKLPSSVPE